MIGLFETLSIILFLFCLIFFSMFLELRKKNIKSMKIINDLTSKKPKMIKCTKCGNSKSTYEDFSTLTNCSNCGFPNKVSLEVSN